MSNRRQILETALNLVVTELGDSRSGYQFHGPSLREGRGFYESEYTFETKAGSLYEVSISLWGLRYLRSQDFYYRDVGGIEDANIAGVSPDVTFTANNSYQQTGEGDVSKVMAIVANILQHWLDHKDGAQHVLRKIVSELGEDESLQTVSKEGLYGSDGIVIDRLTFSPQPTEEELQKSNARGLETKRGRLFKAYATAAGMKVVKSPWDTDDVQALVDFKDDDVVMF